MFKRIIYKLKKNLKKVLYIIVSVQLCVSPGYSYPNNPSPSPGNNQNIDFNSLVSELERIDSEIQRDLTESDKWPEIMEFSRAIEEGKGASFLAGHPGVKTELDLFLLSDQKVESIIYQFDSVQNKDVGVVVDTLHLNDKISSPAHIVCDTVQVIYKADSKTLVFEGVVNGQVVLRQYIPNMDIIQYIHDKEILVLLDRKKGLLLVDMLFASTYLGTTPIPVTKALVPILKYLEKQSTSIEEMRSIDIEFINRTVRPPDVLPADINGLDKNFMEKSIFSAGDLMISYTDIHDKKHLIQFMKRQEMAYWLNSTYNTLEIMMKTTSPDLIKSVEDIKQFMEAQKYFLTGKSKENVSTNILASLLTQNSLHKLLKIAEGVQARTDMLQNLPPRDAFIFEEWRADFNKVSLQIQNWKDHIENNPLDEGQKNQELFNRVKQSTHSRQSIGTEFTTEDIFFLKKEPFSQSKAQEFRYIADKIKAIKQKTKKYFETHAVAHGFYALLIIAFIYYVVIKHSYMDGLSFYSMTALPNAVLIGILLPTAIVLMVMLKTPFLYMWRSISQLTSKKTSSNEGNITHYLKNWKASSIDMKIVSLGFKFVSYTIYPVWNYIAYLVGQPHFFSALQKGLNPFRIISPRSDIGEAAKIKKTTLLGLQKKLSYSEDESFHQKRKLQDIALQKKQRMHTIAWLMAVMALTQKGVDPVQAVIFGAYDFDWEEVKEAHNNKDLRMKIMWVTKNLFKEIRKLDEVDVREIISDLKPEMINHYYRRAKALSEKMENQPKLQKKVRNMVNTVSTFINKTVLRHFTWHNIVSFNENEHTILKKNKPSQFQVHRVLREFVGDHIPVSLIPVISTDRAELFLEHFEKTAINSNQLLLSGGPHLKEVWLNTIAHFFIAGGQTGIVFADTRGRITRAADALVKTYEPMERYSSGIKGHKQSMLNYMSHAFLDYVTKSKGKPDSFGEMVWKRYLARFKCIQMTLTLVVSSRLLLTSQNLSEAILGFWLFHFASWWLFGWPWDIVSGGANMNKEKLSENKRKLEDLQLRLSKVSRGLVDSEQKLFSEYQEVLTKTMELYGFGSNQDKKAQKWQKQMLNSDINTVNPALFLYLNNFDQNRSASVPVPMPQSKEEAQNTTGKLVELISQKPPLPTQANGNADMILTLTLGGFLTTFLFVQLLSIWSFDKSLNYGTIGLWALGHFTGLFLLYQIYAEAYFYKKFMQSKMGRGMKTGWKSMNSWNKYFYNNVLNLKGAAVNTCRRIFSKSPKK